MKYNSKKVLTIIAIICLIIAMSGNCFAHSGRTDSSGGHKDNQNKSGLGSYHYHCGGHPAHLHDNGVCPYSSGSSSSSSSTSSSSKSTTSTSSSKSSTESVAASSSINATSTPVPTPVPTSTPKPIITATSVEINENITNMKVGESIKLTASILPENTEDKSITWSSNDEEIATVSSTGKVVALKKGTVNIIATTSNRKTDTITITVGEVKEIKEDNSIVVPIQSNELNSTSTNSTEDSDAVSGVLGLGLIGGGSYWGYKKYKNKKAKE